MTRRKSVKQLVKPLGKLSFLPQCHTFDLEIKEEEDKRKAPIKKKHESIEIEQNDIVSILPIEVVLKIFSLLSFQDLIRVQLVEQKPKRQYKLMTYMLFLCY